MEKLSEKLPEAFVRNLKAELGEKYAEYENAINSPDVRGLRINTKKITVDEFLKKSKLAGYLRKIDYSSDGFILDSDEKLGNSPEHLSGLIYLQEPSSMIPVCASGIEKEQRPLKVLDLCASPGGKTGQIACRVSDDSLIISNEIIKSRAAVLYSNVERQGFRNVIILNEEPANLECFAGFFDYVFVDSPCSGEGMFRKNPETISEWSEENVEICYKRQKEILSIAQKLVAAGGKLVYSTCTYNKMEDEEISEWFEETFNFESQDVPNEIKKCTLPSNCKYTNSQYKRKFFPFVADGEGQFVAVFKNTDDERKTELFSRKHHSCIYQIGQSENKLVKEFTDKNLKTGFDWHDMFRVGESIYLAPKNFGGDIQTALENLKFNSIGVKLGNIEKGRFEPHHNMFMAFEDLFLNKVELSQGNLVKFLHGDEIIAETNKNGYGVVTFGGYALGGVKIVQGRLKNLYPKGIRI